MSGKYPASNAAGESIAKEKRVSAYSNPISALEGVNPNDEPVLGVHCAEHVICPGYPFHSLAETHAEVGGIRIPCTDDTAEDP